jgi:hypothetical protein
VRLLRILVIATVVYAAIVTAFETLIGVLQPQSGSVLVITTFDDAGVPHDRVVSKLDLDGKLYVATNHWPRAWYRRALAKPEVQATIGGQRSDYRAVPVSGAEHDQVNGAHPLPVFFRILTGFPPRYFLRLDPRTP